MYFGQKKKYKTFLVNNSPDPQEYDITFKKGHGDEARTKFYVLEPYYLG